MKRIISFSILFLAYSLCKAQGTGIELVVPHYHTQFVYSLDLSPNGKFLLTASADNSIILRETSSGNYLREFEEKNPVQEIKFLSDSRFFIIKTDSSVVVRDIANKTSVQKIDGNFHLVAINKKRNEFTTVDDKGAVTIYREINHVFKQYKAIESITGRVTGCTYSEDGQKILLITNSIKLFDFKTEALTPLTIHQIPDSLIQSVALNTDNTTLALGLSNGSVKLYDLKTSTVSASLEVYHSYWCGDPLKGIYKDSARLFDPVNYLEFVDSKHLVSYHNPFNGYHKPGTQFTFDAGNYVDPDDLDKMWDALQMELDNANEETPLQENELWGYRPTLVVWKMDSSVPTYVSAGSELYSFTNEMVATPESIYKPGSYETIPIEGKNTDVAMAKFSAGAKKILINTNYLNSVLDIKQGTNHPMEYYLRSIDFSTHKNFLGVDDLSSNLSLYDVEDDKPGKKIPAVKCAYCKLVFNPVKEHVAFNNADTLIVVDFSTSKILFQAMYDYSDTKIAYSKDGASMVVREGDKIHLFRTSDYSLVDSIPKQLDSDGYTLSTIDNVLAGKDRTYIASRSTYQSNQSIVRRDFNGRSIDTLKIDKRINGMELSPDENWLAFSDSDGGLSIIDLRSPTNVQSWKAHEGQIRSIDFSPNGRFLISAGTDGFIKFWDVKTHELLARLLFYENDWVAVSKDGLFDGSAGGLEKLFFINGLQTIELNQLKDRFYEPGLLAKITGLSQEPLRNSHGLNNIKPYPRIDIDDPAKNDKGLLAIHLTNEGGGIGKVKILINGKEASADARGDGFNADAAKTTILFKLANHPYLRQNDLNQIEIQASNKDGYLTSKPRKFHYLVQGTGQADIRLHAVIIGTSDYNGTELDLRYASKDAEQFASALEESGEKLFGVSSVNIHLLTTDKKENWPTKENIQQAFKEISSTATPYDLLVVYVAGHGTNFGGAEGDFYYLTASAKNGNLSDPAIRKQVAISSNEFTEYIKWVPSLKQIMILDACHSGKFAEDLLAKREAKSSSEIRALERMKDRTGLYILAGSASDAVSYEASVYGQGLLTYSLLFGMKGAALRENKFVDVMELFQYCADEVPRLASNIGGIQKPELRVPFGGESFDIGMVDDQIKENIKIPSPKSVFLRSVFQDEETFGDPLGLSEYLDQQLNDEEIRETGAIIFIDAMKFSDAYSLRGRYKKTGASYEVNCKLLKGDKLFKDMTITGDTLEAIGKKIIEQSINSIPR